MNIQPLTSEQVEESILYLLSAHSEMSRRLDVALGLIEGLARAAGFQPWDGDPETWSAWVEHVSGSRPQD